jgi:hypothetical protein
MNNGKATYLGFFSLDISAKQNTDTGMAMVLILLLVGFFTGQILFYKLAIPVLLINMVYPKIFYPIAVFWLGMSALLGTIMSAIILSVVFMILVVPIGLFRRLLGKDAMQLKKFNETSDSVFLIRNHTYTAQDLENPF